MTDRKSKPTQRKKGGPKQKFASVPRNLPTDTTVIRSSYTVAALSSGTDGSISSSIGASISSVSEYSVLASLYREVKLMAQTIEWYSQSPYATGITTGMFVIGTDMRMNATTYTSPTAYLDVYNMSDRQTWNRRIYTKFTFRRRVPRDLEFTNIADDCPTLPVPFSGSPGVVQIYSSGEAVSTTITTTVLVTATYMLKGRV